MHIHYSIFMQAVMLNVAAIFLVYFHVFPEYVRSWFNEFIGYFIFVIYLNIN